MFETSPTTTSHIASTGCPSLRITAMQPIASIGSMEVLTRISAYRYAPSNNSGVAPNPRSTAGSTGISSAANSAPTTISARTMQQNARFAVAWFPAPRSCDSRIAAPVPIISPRAPDSITTGQVSAAAASPTAPTALPMKKVSTMLYSPAISMPAMDGVM